MNAQEKATIRAYNRIAREYARANKTYSFWRRELEALRKFSPGKKVLEIGCGAGRDAKVFLDDGFDYLGVDASSGLLHIAKQVNPTGMFRLMNYYDLRFPPNSFDGVWSMATLLHVPKKKLPKVLKPIRKLLRPSGVFVVSMKEKSGVDESVVTHDKYGGVTRFFSFYTRLEFTKLLRQAGFTIQKSFRKFKTKIDG